MHSMRIVHNLPPLLFPSQVATATEVATEIEIEAEIGIGIETEIETAGDDGDVLVCLVGHCKCPHSGSWITLHAVDSVTCLLIAVDAIIHLHSFRVCANKNTKCTMMCCGIIFVHSCIADLHLP